MWRRAAWAALFFFVGVYLIVSVTSRAAATMVDHAEIGFPGSVEHVNVRNVPIKKASELVLFDKKQLLMLVWTMSGETGNRIVGEYYRYALSRAMIVTVGLVRKSEIIWEVAAFNKFPIRKYFDVFGGSLAEVFEANRGPFRVYLTGSDIDAEIGALSEDHSIFQSAVGAVQFRPLGEGKTSSKEKTGYGEIFAKCAMLFGASICFAISLILTRKGVHKSGGAGAFIVVLAFPFFLGSLFILSMIFGF
jgi:hypothetical protein